MLVIQCKFALHTLHVEMAMSPSDYHVRNNNLEADMTSCKVMDLFISHNVQRFVILPHDFPVSHMKSVP
jgi:hypothetical protein